MITIRNFVETYIGWRMDESGKNRWNYQCFPKSSTKGCHQCVSLVKFFCKSVYGTPNNPIGDAKAGIELSNQFFQWYEVIKNQIPKRWDIIVFAPTKDNWYYGHIGIVLSANSTQIYYLEQNGGSGDGYGTGNNAIRIKRVGYENVLWYRRAINAKNIIKQDEFDNLVYHNAPYIWEATNYLKRQDVASYITSYFSRSDFWDNSRPNDAITRFELATMISRASGKTINRIYNNSRPNDNATAVEFTIMMNRGKN